MLATVKIGDLREAIIQASHTLDTKTSSMGSWLYLFARQGKPSPAGEDKSALYVYTSNLGLARTMLKIPATVQKEGEVLIPPKLIQSILFGLPAEENIDFGMSPSGAKLQVKYGSLKSEIGIHADSQKAVEVLKTVPFNAQSSFTVSAATLVSLLNHTLFCTASGAAAVAEGVWLSSVHLQTRDGFVLAEATDKVIGGRAEIPDGLVVGDYSFGIHRDALIALKAVLSKRETEEVSVINAPSVQGSSGEVLFRFSDVILGAGQLSQAYPKAVANIFRVPEGFATATINREVLLGCLGRLSAFAEKSSFSLTFATDKATAATRGFNSIIQEQLAKDEKSEGSVTLGLGIANVTNVISAMCSEKVVLRYKTSNDHIFAQEGDAEFKYVLSPVALAWVKEKKAA